MAGSLAASAQEVIVNITPVQQVLPPQVMLYLANPGKYFMLQLTNTTSEPQYVHLGIQIEQFMPDNGLSLSTPARRQPQSPIIVPPNSQIALTSSEMKHLFDHIPQSEISCPANLFSDYAKGKFGLLPEGQYRAHITAYRWSKPQMQTPVVVSSPTGGQCTFTVCYKAQAPRFLLPSTLASKDTDVAELDPLNALFSWTIPTITCNSSLSRYEYSLRVVEIPQGWSVTHALDRAPTVYQRDRLYVPQCIIPQNIVLSEFNANKRYAAQLTAVPASGNALDYVMIENNGKSEPIVFKIKVNEEPEVEKEEEKKEGDDKKEDDKDKDKDKDEKDPKILFGGTGMAEQINPDSLYTFRNPRITKPDFMENGGNYRKLFAGDDVDAVWDPVRHLGGEGLQADTLEFSYTVELFNGGKEGDKESAVKKKPLFTQKTKDKNCKIDWNSLLGKVEAGDYLLLRVTPSVTKGRSVAFVNDTVNLVDFGYIERLSKKYFECSSTVSISNREATSESASSLKGKTVAIGEYTMTIDEIEKKGSGLFKGKGRVDWTPMGFKVGVCVQFDDLGINSDHIVYQGKATSYADPSKASMTDMQAVDKLFSDWGIDNLIGETGLTSRDQLQNAGAGDIAKKLKLAKYYKYIKTGQGILKGSIDRAYMPLSVPKSVNSSPVDIQIVGMTFAADYATMNIMGEFTLPDTKYTDDEILVLGAPRICISPDKIIPESGTLALLSDFTIKDPKTTYTMKFKAPKNVITPNDGCYVAWHDYKFEILGVDIDMNIPKLKKDVGGTATTQNPTMHIQASVADWEDFLVDDVSIDNFQVDDLPGWTFKASNIVYDHSRYRNSAKMGSFPTNYQKSKAGVTRWDNTDWQGLYIKTVGVEFPKSLEVGTSGNKRLTISADNMFFDKSGASLELNAQDVLSAKTGKLGGWSFSLDNINLSFLQNDFKNCKFNGKFDVPLLEGQIAYTCNILRIMKNGAPSGDYAYIFKTQQTDKLSLDFILAKATWNKKQTYMLVEATPTTPGGALKTKVELVMGGDVTVGGTSYLNQKAKNLPMKFEIPGIHFSHMRIANCSEWTSQYEKELQQGGKKDSKGTTLYAGKEIKLSNSCYFHTGRWSLASAEKTLGPFSLSLKDYKFNYANNKLNTSLVGKIALVKGIDISATAGITIVSNVQNLSNISNFKMSYSSTKFDKISLNTSFAGLTLKGSLEASSSTDANKSEGYGGSLKITMPGDLFTVDTNGGFYKYASGSTKYTWGFFNIKLGSATGLHLDPVVINSIKGGFYFNCKKSGTNSATPQKDLIGVIAGMGLSTTAGKEMLNGDFDMTVVYDKSYKRLTTFMFEGAIKAVSGLVDSKASIVYQHDNTDKFFALNVTVDAKADGAKLANQYAGEYNRLGSLMKQLNSGYEKAVGNVKQGLKGKIDENTGANKNHKTKAKGGDSSVKASAGATITLDFKITMKKNGKTQSPVKWHLYLGEPDYKKRCSFTLIDFKSKIVSVKIGANAYLCIGNELPNNGQLPPIPSEVSNFLDGSSKGSGVVSDDVSKATRARTRALQDFKADTRGGVMLGAQVYGYVDVDLGIFYGNMGATAGFDMSLQKLSSNATCTNLGRKPGWNGWYGEGQLYAYLYAKFGLRINLGFFKKDFDIVDAGIGGVLNMGGPKPTYFTGKARVKLRLLNGLVNMNRSFKFECGDRCDLFMGNALDNFQLFGECSIADTTKTNGWNASRRIDPTQTVRPTISTDAPLNEHFRVLDETELARLSKQFDADKEQLKSLASRTFVFRSNTWITLYEYASKNSSYPTSTRYYNFKGNSRTEHSIDMMYFNPNRYYKMEVTGWAAEIEKGREVNPVYFDTRTGKYTHKPWKQTKTYYFCTGPSKTIDDVVDLQDYVALAYPSHYNQIKDIKYFETAYVSDVKAPTIALKANIQGKAFRKGTLKWRLYNSSLKKIDETNNSWVTSSNNYGKTLNMQPARSFTGVYSGSCYYIMLDYETSSKDKNGKISTQSTNLARIPVYAVNGNWRNGYNNGNSRTAYDYPFVSARLNYVNWKYNKPYRVSDKSISQADGTKQNGYLLRLSDPYWYLSYLTNYAFVGGWQLSAERIKAAATTSQSLIYTTVDGVYEGTLGKGVSYNIYDNYEKVRDMSVYTSEKWSPNARFPLPYIESNSYSYVNSGLKRIPIPNRSSSNVKFVSPIISQLYKPYVLAERISSTISTNLIQLSNMTDNKYETKKVNKVEAWNNARVGTYASYTSGYDKVEIPYYQFAILWGSQFANKGARKKVTMWGAFDDLKKSDERGHENLCEEIYYGFIGGKMDHKANGSKNRAKESFTVTYEMRNRITNANFSIYRVNAYDYVDGQYIVVNGMNNGNTFESFDIKNVLNSNW